MGAIYLDHNATTGVRAEVRAAMAPFLEAELGNPSSLHAAGRRAREAMERAREEVARLCGADASEIVFTSGGTEANNLAIRGLALAVRATDPHRDRVIVTGLEHPSALAAVEALSSLGLQ